MSSRPSSTEFNHIISNTITFFLINNIKVLTIKVDILLGKLTKHTRSLANKYQKHYDLEFPCIAIKMTIFALLQSI